MVQTVREFVRDAYNIVNPQSPTQALHGDDQNVAINLLNRLLKQYSANGLLITTDKDISHVITASTQNVTFGEASSGADVTEGILSYVYSAFLLLDGTSYPLKHTSRAIFNQSYRYDPLLGLPRFFIMDYGIQTTDLRLYPGASQEYTLKLSGKFSKQTLTSNDDTSILPDYSLRFYQLALARDICMYKARMDAWTKELEQYYKEARDEMIAATPVNVKIYADNDALLNGAARVRAGI